MKYPKVKIDLSRYQWAIDTTDVVDKDSIYKRFPKIIDWISGEEQSTMRELSDFSLMTHIPIGYFFLKNAPVRQIELLEYRTIKSHQNTNPSQNLIDIILQMTDIQNWMHDFYVYSQEPKNSFVFTLGHSSIDSIASEIRNKLSIDVEFYRGKGIGQPFSFIRNKIQALNIIVNMSGIVGANTKRKLNLNEFRAFTMIDDYVPLIFINTQDSDSGKYFSLVHELVHVGLGKNSLYNVDQHNYIDSFDNIEQLCNAVAAEILVPVQIFKDLWEKYNYTDKKISELSAYFKVSEVVIARRAFDLNFISPDKFNEIAQISKFKFLNAKKRKGGDSFKNFFSRFDINFLQLVNQCVQTGYLLHTDAYHLLNVSRTFFDKVMMCMSEGGY